MEEQKRPNLWLMRMVIVNIIAGLFIIFKHETFDQAMYRLMFVNIFCLAFFLITDGLTYLALSFLKRKLDK